MYKQSADSVAPNLILVEFSFAVVKLAFFPVLPACLISRSKHYTQISFFTINMKVVHMSLNYQSLSCFFFQLVLVGLLVVFANDCFREWRLRLVLPQTWFLNIFSNGILVFFRVNMFLFVPVPDPFPTLALLLIVNTEFVFVWFLVTLEQPELLVSFIAVLTTKYFFANDSIDW